MHPLKWIRAVLRVLILSYDRIFVPKVLIKRSPTEQMNLNSKLQDWCLYQLEACPFCVKVRRQMKRLSIEIPLKNVNRDALAQQELMEHGKIDQVPCLKYRDETGEFHWLYESSEINQFLLRLSQ